MIMPLFCLLFALPHQANAAAPLHRYNLDAYFHEVTLSNPQVSPDGRRIAVVRSRPDFSADRAVTTLLLIDAATGRLRALTDGKAGVASPRWSPQGDRLAYLSTGKNGADQIFVMPSNSGPAQQVTQAPNGVQQFAWKPDGKQFVYVTQDDDPHQADIRRHDDLFEIHDDGYLSQHAALPSHLWLVASQGGPARRLTRGVWSVEETPSPFVGGPGAPSWSPDGQWVAFARQANPDNGDGDLCTIAAVEVATGKVRQITGKTSYEYQPAFSPRDRAIAFIRPHGPTSLSSMDLCLTSPTGGEQNLSADLDRDVLALAWTPEGSELLLEANEGIQTGLWRLKRSGQAQRLDLGQLSAQDYSPGPRGAVAIVASGPDAPQELYWLSGPTGKLRRLTDFNAALRAFSTGRVTEFRWNAPDGEACDGVLTYPVNHTPSQRYPLAVVIHGGPEAASGSQYESNPLRQTLAGRGYFVFEPNYRGSDNLGNAHEHAIYRDPGEGPGKDVISGIEAIAAAGLIDPNRISVAGHSYGGYMTAWLIGHDHRWRSAIVSDGLTSWTDLYNLAADGNLAMARDSLGGTPSDPDSDLYRTGSPITYAAAITTPTLIMHGTADETVPITSSYALYHTLKDRHTPVRFIALPGAHHHPGDPVRQKRFYELMVQWILEHDPDK
jgi:dipeptidyl aminopeptidase/acylaminoacyl peptidase